MSIYPILLSLILQGTEIKFLKAEMITLILIK